MVLNPAVLHAIQSLLCHASHTPTHYYYNMHKITRRGFQNNGTLQSLGRDWIAHLDQQITGEEKRTEKRSARTKKKTSMLTVYTPNIFFPNLCVICLVHFVVCSILPAPPEILRDFTFALEHRNCGISNRRL